MALPVPPATLTVGSRSFEVVDLRAAEAAGLAPVSRLPITLRILLENVLRHREEEGSEAAADGVPAGSEAAAGGVPAGSEAAADDVRAFREWIDAGASEREIGFRPARILMPDSSAVPLVADLAALRDAVRDAGAEPACVNPLVPVDIVIDHSVAVDHAGTPQAFELNLALEYRRNAERYRLLRWAQESFSNVRVVPPSTGIVHQVNMECLAQVVRVTGRDADRYGRVGGRDARTGGPVAGRDAHTSGRLAGRDTRDGIRACPDTLVGMDSHTPMVNAIGVVGWGVGGIEAGAAMLGQPIPMLLPKVVGCRLTGRPRAGVTGTDIVLAITERLRRHGVVGKFVEFHGDGLDGLPVPHRATIANMAPEAGATMCFFPTDAATLAYLLATGRDPDHVALVDAYTQAQRLRRCDDSDIAYTERLEFDLGEVRPSMAGPRRPQDRVDLADAPRSFSAAYADRLDPRHAPPIAEVRGAGHRLAHGDIVIAAITSCTNTSNPHAMIGAGLLARKLAARGVRPRPWVRTSLSPGSRVVSDYLQAAGLQPHLDALGFHLAGYGCMTCVGGSGPLDPCIAQQIEARDVVAVAVLSGNRNFEGRTHPLVRAAYLCSPALVVAYACAGSIARDLTREPLAVDREGRPVWLSDVWPTDEEVDALVARHVQPALFAERYANVFAGDARWQQLTAPVGSHYPWDPASTAVRRPPYFEADRAGEEDGGDVQGARPLAILGDSITTDHISPVGAIGVDSVAGTYLAGLGVPASDLGTLLGRRGNHEVMIRGTFANARLRNEMAHGREGGWTRHEPSGELMTVFDAAQRYRIDGVPLVIVAGADYGCGSSRDWAAKGPRFLGVRAVLAESFERIHRSNLVGMGVLPLQFPPGTTRRSLGLCGGETFDFRGLGASLAPGRTVPCEIHRPGRPSSVVPLVCRLDTPREVQWYRAGGVLPYVTASLLSDARR